MKRFFFAIIAGLAAFAFATTYQKLSLEEQVKRADVILNANILALREEERGGKPWTVYVLQPIKMLKGEAKDIFGPDGTPQFAVLGGKNLRVLGAPAFKETEQVVLMLYTKNYDSPIVGFRQGAYKVTGTDEHVEDLDGKAVSIGQDNKSIEANKAQLLSEIEKIIGGAK